MQLEKLKIRQAWYEDIRIFRDIADAMKSAKAPDYFENAFAHQDAGERLVFLLEYDEEVCGYCMLSWSPKYGHYRAIGCPEIQDLNVLPAFRKKGIASAMITHCEDLARDKGHTQMGISVGLTPRYGAAQRLYVKLGYVPDGHGVTCDRKSVAHGEFRSIDDDLCLMMLKTL